jgi:LPS export ABC transporter protein LptC
MFSYFLVGCENSKDDIKNITTRDTLPSESAKEVTFFFSDSAKIKMKMVSPKVENYPGSNAYIEFPKGIHIWFYDDSMQVETEITANYAIRHEKEFLMEAKNDVVVTNKEGERLNTEHLIWDEKKEMIYTKEFVRITTASEVVYGTGLESDQNFTKYKINNIKGTFNVENE